MRFFRIICLLSIVCFSNISFAQKYFKGVVRDGITLNLPEGTGESISFSKVIQIEGVGEDYIIQTIEEIFKSNYKKKDNLINVEDIDTMKNGSILEMASGKMKYSYGKLVYKCYEGYTYYNIYFNIEDSRCEIELTDFYHENKPANNLECNFGLITTDSIIDKVITTGYTMNGDQITDITSYNLQESVNKDYHNRVWLDMKQKAVDLSNEIFILVENELLNHK